MPAGYRSAHQKLQSSPKSRLIYTKIRSVIEELINNAIIIATLWKKLV